MEAYNNLGLFYEEVKKDYIEAEKNYRQALEINPKYARAWYNLGILYQDVKKNLKESEKYYRKCVETDPEYKNAWKLLGELYKKIGKLEESQDCFAKFNNLRYFFEIYYLIKFFAYLSKIV